MGSGAPATSWLCNRALDALNARSQAHARRLAEGLKEIRSILLLRMLENTSPVYYQYCIRVSDPSTLSRRAIRHGIDLEIMHVDICTKLDLFAPYASACPIAESTQGTLQLPVYSGLRPKYIDRIVRVIRDVSRDLPPLTMADVAQATGSISEDGSSC
ncbi:MAG: DegT/DnrJ/EryC1/StrS family aminotransferase [Acidobacteria bacterium]|nr:DegT/DnrJ/EryC1/StrS family aminotransferase [Acidobacteriota bacterium]